MPRSKSKPRYLLYSSLVFCHSQAPIFVTAKCLTQISITPVLSQDQRIDRDLGWARCLVAMEMGAWLRQNTRLE